MARVAQRDGATALSRLAGDAEICPVCSSGSYLNANLKFKLNPECYHKMCDNCVARIFRNGPALCPYAGCSKTLRFNRFRDLTFEDVRTEKEVDIRRRMARIFNKCEDDFETLADYNDYLNTVEDITFDLVAGDNVEQRNREIAAYQEHEARSIADNAELESRQAQSFRARQALEQEQARQRREAAAREERDEKRERLEGRLDYIRKLQSSDGGARKIAGERERERLRKAQAKRSDADLPPMPASAAATAATAAGVSASSDLLFSGLKQRTAPQPEKPYDPFDGMSVEKQYFTLQKDYAWDWLAQGKKPLWTAGGYDMTEYCGRALTDAFAGLAVFVADEVRDRDRHTAPVAATRAAETAVGPADVF